MRLDSLPGSDAPVSEEVIRSVMFDLDGTLVDSLLGIAGAITRVLANAGVSPRTSDVRTVVGPPVRVVLQRVTGIDNAARLDELERAFRHEYDSVGWTHTVPYDGALDLVQRLAEAGKRLYVVTNKPSLAALRILDRVGLRPYFVDVVTPDRATPAFPTKAHMLDFLIRNYALDPSACLMVGDTYEDYEAATTHGMRAALVKYGYGDSRVTAVPCDKVERLDELMALCGGKK
jgi:phosphoglycolate phosphatase